MVALKLTLFGSFQVQLHNQPNTHFESDKVRALLAFLVMDAGCTHRREALAGLLWPDRPDQAALTNLRHALSSLRKSTGDQQSDPPYFLVNPGTICFNPESDFWLDAAEFDRMVRIGHTPGSNRLQVVEQLQNAVALYRGDFLEGFSLRDSPPFEEWILIQREHYRQAAVQALDSLAGFYEQGGDLDLAQIFARRQVELDPLDEAAHRRMMRLQALSGQRSGALRQFEACRRRLFEELQVEPARETLELYEHIKAGKNLQAESWQPPPQPASEQLSVPFVARDRELAALYHHLESARAGHGRVVFITGETGSGKTSLAWEFARRAMTMAGGETGWLVAAGSCNAFGGQGDPYLPFREILGTLTGDIEARRASGAIRPQHAQRLWAAFPDAIQTLVEAGPDLVGLFLPADPLILRARAFAPVGAAWQSRLADLVGRQKQAVSPPALEQLDLFEQVTGVLQELARRHPLLLLLDDLQWADNGSLGLLFHLGRRLAGSRLLVIGAYRPDGLAREPGEDRHPLELLINEFERDFGDIQVDLTDAQSPQFVDAYLNTQPNRLGPIFRENLYHHTEGNALFTVELLRGLQERGDLVQDESGRWIERANLDWEQLPARVEAVIAERIGRLSKECQSLLEIASVEGEEFTAEVLARLQGVAEMEVVHCLGGLLKDQHDMVRAQELQRIGRRRRSRYRFRHALFQKYLYNHLDPAERSRLHEGMGEALEALYGEQIPELAVQLAWHFEEAGLPERAADYLLQAGNRAVQLSAHSEAIGHFMHAITLLQSLPQTRERDEKEFHLQSRLFVPLIGVRGWSAPEQTHAFNRMLELRQKIGQNPDELHNFQHLYATAAHHFARGELSRSVALSEQLLSLARQSQDPAEEVVARMLLGASLMLSGELVRARDHLEQAWALYDPDRLRPTTAMTGIEVGVFLRGYQAIAWWMRGYPDRAWQTAQAMLSQAQALNHPLSLDFAQIYVVPMIIFLIHGSLKSFQGPWTRLQPVPEIDRAFFSHFYAVLQGFSQFEQGKIGEGIAHMQRSLADLPITGIQAGRPALLYLLATAQRKAGQPDAGLASIQEILPLLENANQYWLSGFYHLRGELLVCQQHAMAASQISIKEHSIESIQEAENCFLKAIEVARRQEAKSWELKATISLARLWQQGERAAEARQLLEAIYAWFTEGFDMPDLVEAWALLETLKPSRKELIHLTENT